METIFRDLRYGARMLLKKPGFTLIAVITIALGVGATTATFSVVNALLFRPLPFRDPGRLVWIANTGHSGLSGATTRVGSFQEWRKLNQSFQDLAAYFAFFDYGSYTMTGMGDPERLSGVGVSGNFLSVLGVQPMLGRGFVDDECKWNGKKAVILGNSFWQRRFGSDAGVIGRSITLNGQPTTIVGVMPASFDFASVFSPGSKVDMVMPFPITEETDKWGNTLAVIGRLKTGASVQNAQAEFDVIDQQLYRAHPERGQFGAKLSSLQEQISRGFRLPFLVLLGAVACVLLIACANVSNLLLARASGRRKEIAVRVALGAGKGRLVAQMLTESLMLSFCGAALGLPLAFAATHLVASTQAVNLPLLQTVGVDWTAMFFTLIVAVSTGLLFGIVPALQTSRLDVHETLKDAGRGLSDGKRKAWVRGA
ncbi:MAG TPA: ABC transporter permease, partial [Blastocatellia bacterium]|nr:ABC transporter permease [Blastocatellia bacterium]